MKLRWRLVFAMMTAIFLAGCNALDPCENVLLRQAMSLDGKLKAVVFSRGCGATTSESVQISILQASAVLPNEAGNIFVAEEANIYVKWLSTSQLQITVPAKAQIFHKQQKHGAIQIVYKTQ